MPLGFGLSLNPRRAVAALANSATDWYFAQFGLAGTPWADVSRTGLGTRVDSAGLVRFGPHNLLLNSRLAGAVAGTPGTAPTSWGLGFSTGRISAVEADGVTFTATAQRIVCTQSISVSAGSVYSVTCVVRSNSGLEFSRLLLINQVITGATSTRFANGSPVASTYVPQAGDRIEERLTTTTNSGTMQVRIGVGCDTADTGTAKLDLIRVQEGGDIGAATDLATVTTTTARYLPRITHDPVTLSALGLLVEGQGTNLVSTNFANWTDLAATRNLNAAIAPDGTTTAMHLVETAVTQVHRANYSFTPSATGAHVSWCYVKAGARSRVYLQNDFGSANSTAEYNLATGTVGAITGIGGTAGIRPWSNGWFLIWFSTTTTTTNAGQVRLYLGDSTSNQSYAGDGSSGAFFWGANTTQGTVPTSHIPNPGTGSAVRVADTWRLESTGLAQAFPAGTDANTVYVEFERRYTSTSDEAVVYIGTGGFGAGNLMVYTSGANLLVTNASQTRSLGAYSTTGRNKLAVSYDRVSGAWSASLNGGAAVQVTATTINVPTRLALGSDAAGSFLTTASVYARGTVYAGQYITGAALQALTA